jgi:4-amino-4-deoxychorismate lyase
MVSLDHSSSNFPIDDRILLGEGLFETIKVQQGKALFPELHWQRLNNAAQYLKIRFTLPKREWGNLLDNTIQKDNLINGGLKAILSGGVAVRGLVAQGQESRLLVQSFSYTHQNTALRLLPASWTRDANNPLYQFKTINYLEAVLARREALQKGADDALFFNTKQHITEATCANIFLINNGRFITPPLHDGVLPGITRLRILNHCARLGFLYEESSINKELLEQADAVFLTNSLQGIHYVKTIDTLSFALTNPLVQQMILVLAEEEQFFLSMAHND